ncbi:hypothetical protein BREVUG8_110452 [Brevundimonas sp. G8]|nr:hypothetical protein BREVUG8_110452 [Brevundimonas sp. G8]
MIQAIANIRDISLKRMKYCALLSWKHGGSLYDLPI